MPNKFSLTNMSKRQIKNTVRASVYAVILFVALFVAYIYWFGAGMALCGISGCSGGGFGVSYNPERVKAVLFQSGLVATIAPVIIFSFLSSNGGG